MPGYKDWRKVIPYPLSQPNVAKAKALKPRKGTAVLYAANSPVAQAQVQIVKSNLAKIGINAKEQLFPFAVRIRKEGHRGEPYDLDLQAWGSDYPDPVDFVDILLDGKNIAAENNNDNAYFDNPSFNRRMATAAKMLPPKRYAAWAAIDRDVMQQQAPLAPLFVRTQREFLSKRMGCYTYQPIYTTGNLNTPCIK
jgi:ABC-type transport system substrate-binding protein